MHTRILTEDAELTLIYNFISDNHREDVSTLDADIFQYKKLFQDVSEGLTLTELGATSTEKYGVSAYSIMKRSDSFSFDYRVAYGEALQVMHEMYSERLKESTGSDAEELLKKIEQTNNLIHSKDTSTKTKDFSSLFFNELETRQTEKNPKYGIKLIDKDTDGLHRGQLIVLSARPGCGKSALALQITNKVCNQGYKTLYLPLEMTEYETFQRMLIQEQICYDAEEVKHPTKEQQENIKDYLDLVEKNGNFCMYSGLNDLAGIERKIKEEKPFLVVVDQLTQVETGTKNKDIRDKYIKVTNTLKRIALQENVCILALSQLNREATNRKTPGLENLAESDSTGRDADVVLMIKVNDEEDYKSLKSVEIIIEKNRQGANGRKIPMQFNGSRYTFFETEHKDFVPAYRERI